MKKTIIILSLFFVTIVSFGQNQSKDSAQKSDTLAILNYQQANQIISYMSAQAGGTVDVKPAIWNDLIQMLVKAIKIYPIPQPKQQKK